jgi:hypothetical protein
LPEPSLPAEAAGWPVAALLGAKVLEVPEAALAGAARSDDRGGVVGIGGGGPSCDISAARAPLKPSALAPA